MSETKTKFYVPEETKLTLQVALKKQLPILLIGETGTGKTSLVRYMAQQAGKKYYRINLNGQSDTSDIVGKYIIKDNQTKWIDGILIRAMKEGAYIVLDELNACTAEVLFAIHSLLDDDHKIILTDKDGSEVTPHQDFRLFATINPSNSDYAGTQDLNRALMSRFGVVLYLDYTDKEKELLVEAGATPDLADNLVTIANEIRNGKNKGVLNFIVSTRDLLQTVELVNSELPLPQALQVAILNKANPAEREGVAKIVELITGKIKLAGTTKTFVSVVEALKYASYALYYHLQAVRLRHQNPFSFGPYYSL